MASTVQTIPTNLFVLSDRFVVTSKGKRFLRNESGNHSKLITHFFPDCNGSGCGVDLPAALFSNGYCIEVKECFTNYRMAITLHDYDQRADFLLFFYWKNKTFYLLDNSLIRYHVHGEKTQGVGKKFIFNNYIKKWVITKNMSLKKKLDFITYVNYMRVYGVLPK